MLSAHAVRKTFHTASGPVVAVHDVSLTCHPGEVVGILGANGAGKTTTLRLLSGILRPDAGTVNVEGYDVATAIQARHLLGVLPDARGLYTRLTARENIAYFADLYGLSFSQYSKRLEQIADVLEMQDILDRPAQGFSQGQRTKTALARALIHDPPYLLLDEPTNGLDVLAARAVRQTLLSLKAQGRGILFSSHIMSEVTAVCSRVVMIHDGRVLAEGTPQDLCEKTQSTHLEEAFVRLRAAVVSSSLPAS